MDASELKLNGKKITALRLIRADDGEVDMQIITDAHPSLEAKTKTIVTRGKEETQSTILREIARLKSTPGAGPVVVHFN